MFRFINFLIFFILAFKLSFGQNYFSKRLNLFNKASFTQWGGFYKADTIILLNNIYETYFPNPVQYAGLFKISVSDGSVLSSFKFGSAKYNNLVGVDILKQNNSYFAQNIDGSNYSVVTAIAKVTLGLDTVFTKTYGDTNYYFYQTRILPFKKTKNKLLLFGATDSTFGTNHPNKSRPFLRVVDTNGVLHQTKIYLNNLTSLLNLWNVDTTVKKGYILSGNTYAGNINRHFILKLDSNLTQEWVRYIDTSSSIAAHAQPVKKGGYILSHAKTISINVNSLLAEDKIALTRLDGNGNIKWRKVYGNAEPYLSPIRVRECLNGDFIIAGYRRFYYTPSVSQDLGCLIRTDSLGNLKWWKQYIQTSPIKDTIAVATIYDLTELPNKDFIGIGTLSSSSISGQLFSTWLLKVDSNGCFSGSNCPNNTYVGLQEVDVWPQNKLVFNVYPNPANEIINVELESVNGDPIKNYKLEIINSLGQLVLASSLGEDGRGAFNISKCPRGIYFVKLTSNNQATLSKKIIIER
ncbi:MAG: T9SS type A sorting domain-containing protein [Bacteroidota bacterium]|jgi:hypothetical protein